MNQVINVLVELMLMPMTALCGLYLKVIGKSRLRGGYHRTKINRALLKKIGVYPIIDHFYEPLFNDVHLKKSLRDDRALPGIDFNEKEQLALLNKFRFEEELLTFPLEKDTGGYYYHNGWFEAGDAEYLYNIIRLLKPKRIIEVGGGWSTLIATAAVKRNRHEISSYSCEYTCIEPYSNPWLEKENICVIRRPVESVDKELFSSLEHNDILFIDSSHIIRPQGDVLYLYLEILPSIKPGVMVHIHDIFTPKDYISEWIQDQGLFWNEQYLLEAFLSQNKEYEIVGALNFLKHKYWKEIAAKCPILQSEPMYEPRSFWIRKL